MSQKKNSVSKPKSTESALAGVKSKSSSNRSPTKNTQRQSGSSRKNTSPKKKKQATLLELTKKGGGVKLMGSPSPSKQKLTARTRKAAQPIIILKLMSLKKEKEFRSQKYKLTLNAACKILTEQQRNNAPELIKEDIIKKWEFREKRRKFQLLTDAEKRAFSNEKQRKYTQDLRAASRIMKSEDQHIPPSASKSLPDLNLVSLPEGLPNTTFGDIAMLCEFFHCYHTLLCPKDAIFHKQFNIQTITTAVTAGKTGFNLTSKMLVILLQTLFADNIAKDYSEVEYPLYQILVTPEVSCELTRICLRQHDDVQSESASSADGIDTGLAESTSRRLFEMELYEMEPVEQVEVLSALAYRVMNTYAVQAHMEDAMLKASSMWNKLVQQNKERKQKLIEEQNVKSVNNNERNPKLVIEKLPKIDNADDSNNEIAHTEKDMDLVSRVKKRKLLSEQYRKEEQERKEKLREEQDKLIEEQELEKTNRQLMETRTKSVHLRRKVPLGTDRNHSRYWLFCGGVPGLYIEKGWVGDHINYCTNPDFKIDHLPSSPTKSPRKKMQNFDFATPRSATKSARSSDDDDDLPLSQISNSSNKKATFRRSKDECTWPRSGQNLWLSVDSQESLDKLMESFHVNGIREMKLHSVLKKNYDVIVKSLNKRRIMQEVSCEPATRRSALLADGEEFHRTLAASNLQSLVRDCCRGSLANIEEPDIFEQRIATLETVPQFSALLLELFEAIPTRFLKRYMSGVSDTRKVKVENEVNLDREKPVAAVRRVAKWTQAVEEATLFSRFCLLMSILKDSINWKMCDWSRPSTRRRSARNKNYADMNEGIVEDEEEESEDDERRRRSSRIKGKKQTKSPPGKVFSGKRRTRKPIKYRVVSSDEEETGEEENDSNGESDSSEDGSRIRNNKNKDQTDTEDAEFNSSDDDAEAESSICRNIIGKFLKYQYSEIFRDPVDREDVPDYYDIISHPICLNDILNKIDECDDAKDNSYTSEMLMKDIRLLLDNADAYNSEESFTVKQARKLETAFVRFCNDSFTEPAQRTLLRSLFKNTQI